MYKKPFLILGVFLNLLSCVIRNNTLSIDKDLYEKIELVQGSPFEQSLNTKGSFLLIWKLDEASGVPITKYSIWNTDTHNQQYSGSFRCREIHWLDNTHLLFEEIPGIVDQNNLNFQYKIDVIEKTKTQYTNAYKN